MFWLSQVKLAKMHTYTFCGIFFFFQMQEFSAKARSVLPRVPKREPQGKSDFKTVRELVHYILDEDERNKRNSLQEAKFTSDQR